jgi:predicted small lipoprotein YifL
MNRLIKFTVIAGFAALAACGGKGDDSLGDNVADAYDNAADQLDAMADNTTNAVQEETLENQADALRETGKEKEEAIDEADANAAAANQAAANAM